MTSHIVKGFPFFRDKEPIDLPIANLVDLPAKGVADLLLEEIINSSRRFHCSLILFYIFKPLPSYHRANRHDGTGEGLACFSFSGHATSKSTPCFENLLASYIELFLQRCKNGLGSSKVVHVVLKRQFKDLFK